MTTRRKVWIGVAIFAIAVAIYWPFSAGGRQQMNMHRGQRHIDQIEKQITSDARFARIEMKPYTGSNGSIGVAGTLETPEDADALFDLMESTNPPVDVVFFVELEPMTTTQESSTRERAIRLPIISGNRKR